MEGIMFDDDNLELQLMQLEVLALEPALLELSLLHALVGEELDELLGKEGLCPSSC